MSQRIPQSFIDELISRADIVDVIGSRVGLKRAGRDYKGLCPFHDEKTPSFTVSPAKGFYHCFGCGAHGTAIGFLMSYENASFPEAVETLAGMLSLEVPRDSNAPEPAEHAGLLAVLREADQIFRHALRESSTAIEYLKKRGIDGATAGRFALGYAPDAWDTLLRELGQTEDRVAALIEAGLAIRNEQGRCYDRFRDRIMFPIRNPRGEVIGFGGRVIGAGEPKYLNSPETPVFHKGRTLYGLYEARRHHGRPEQVIVVEGYLDVAGLAQFGIEPAVATLGTATTAEHVRVLTRMADRVVFCFDGDRAGRAAAWRALETVLPLAGGNVELKFLLLPEGEDPDSLVRARGADAFRELLAAAVPLSEYLVGELGARVDATHADGRAKLVTLARPLLDRLPHGLYRELLSRELAERVGLEPGRFAELLGDKAQGKPAAAAPRPVRELPAHPTAEAKPTPVRYAIKLVLHYPAAARAVGDVEGLDKVDERGVALLRQLLEIARSNPHIQAAHLLERFRGEPAERHLERLAAQPPLDEEQEAVKVLRDSLERIVRNHERRQTAQAIRKSRGDLN
ncbi:MAG TPA: DNA primase [Gammaproteobacteria bacterium]|nr:DNA primase [Gammaproteobacteria bacterium]